MEDVINVIFDGPPSHESGRFVEVETNDGKSINIGEWVAREDGLWALRIDIAPQQQDLIDELVDMLRETKRHIPAEIQLKINTVLAKAEGRE